jgi:predicted extracellular nuclease
MKLMRSALLAAITVALCTACQPELGPGGIPIAGDGALVCGQLSAPIHAVQGNQAMSPVVGEIVEVEARISAKFIDGLGGFNLVSEPGSEDQDAASSEGLFVRHAEKMSWPIGTRIRVRGTVAELGAAPDSQTALIELRGLVECDKPVKLAARDVGSAGSEPQYWERFEGERVLVNGPVTLVGNERLLREGAMIISFDGRDFTPTERHAPGPDARALEQANLATRLVLDDARLDEYPAKYWHLPEALTPESAYRVDSQLGGIEGVLEQRDGEYRVQLVKAVGNVVHAPRPNAPPDVDGDLRVASFNVLNFFNGDGAGGGFPTARGAQNGEAYKRQAAKIVSALDAMDADVVALMEVENDGFGETSAIHDLVTRLNKLRGKERGDYVFVNPGLERVGSDEIMVALIYRTSRVHTVGEAAVLLTPPFDRWSRPPLAQRFEAGTLDFTVVANHFKSKNCQDAEGTEHDQDDGQGCFNAKRVESARVLSDWVASDPVRSGHDRVLLIGDLNAYGLEDPVRLLQSRGYADVLAAHLAEPGYSYVFGGTSGRLDHALAGASLAELVGGAGEWHINADESSGFEYSQPDYDRRALKTRFRADPFRSSDHDPLLIGLRVASPPAPPVPPADAAN